MNQTAAPATYDENSNGDMDAVTTATQPTSHPVGFFFIFFGEFAERCSYYGMRAIMLLYLVNVLQFEQDNAITLYQLFKAACYLLPLLGGFLADRYFGKYWTIVGFSVPYVLGHFVLGIETQTALLIAMFLLAGGSGVIKPNISTLMGMTYDQQRPGQTALRTSGFLWFYFSINIGAMISMYYLPNLREELAAAHVGKHSYALGANAALPATDLGYLVNVAAVGVEVRREGLAYAYPIAFQIPAWLMVAALGIFAFGKRFYAIEKLGPPPEKTPEEREQQWRTLATLFGIFVMMVFWWMVYEQNDNLWTLFARDHVNLTLNLGYEQKTFAPDGFQFINSMFVLVFAPLCGTLFRLIDPHTRFLTATTKMLAGFLISAASSGIMTMAATAAAGGDRVNAWWMVIAYIVFTLGEVLVYGTGLELSFAVAPANMKGFITACFLVTNFVGNALNSYFSRFYGEFSPQKFFAISTAFAAVTAVAFYFVGRRFHHATRPKVDTGAA